MGVLMRISHMTKKTGKTFRIHFFFLLKGGVSCIILVGINKCMLLFTNKNLFVDLAWTLCLNDATVHSSVLCSFFPYHLALKNITCKGEKAAEGRPYCSLRLPERRL